MPRRIDLGKLVKMADDAHQGFNNFMPSTTPVQHPDVLIELALYQSLKSKHHNAVEAKVSFNLLRLFQVRLLTHWYLLRFGNYRRYYQP